MPARLFHHKVGFTHPTRSGSFPLLYHAAMKIKKNRREH